MIVITKLIEADFYSSIMNGVLNVIVSKTVNDTKLN